jgi:hypothetical protein
MALEFTVCEDRWDRYPRVPENPHGREWLEFQSSRGLAANTLDAYGRNLDAYLGFLASKGIPFDGVVRSTVGLYIRAIADLPVPKVLKGGREARTRLANATLQQHLTVVRLFHDFLVEENVCIRNPLRAPNGGRGLIQRHHRLPWIPSEEEWQNIQNYTAVRAFFADLQQWGVIPATLRSVWQSHSATFYQSPPRSVPTRNRGRRVGEACMGRTQSDSGGHCSQASRQGKRHGTHVPSHRDGPRASTSVVVCWSAARRNPATAGRVRALAARRWITGVLSGCPSEQDRSSPYIRRVRIGDRRRSLATGSGGFRFGFAAIELTHDIGANRPRRDLRGLGLLAFAIGLLIGRAD